ncbi:DUF6022 family protein [Paenibacillus sp. Soil750]|uniref:DUF6022 family protein n=1 Tax=Paenibacillus sp. Soil750 TaxID=1736398 RepID=UPI0006FB3D1E|nr:DUF6022 family protein [Paenibacillus sp. Soil750]KRE70004.1 hypothetical protein ASL11_16750 [Paenibacillus sp. Soil750]
MTNNQIDLLFRKAENRLSDTWKSVYENKQTELISMFNEYGDRAYSVWIQDFMAHVVEPFQQEGYQIKAGFNRHNSIENWGPPEERERCAWYLIHDHVGTPIGTLVLQIYHSHRSFFVPRAPQLLFLQVTEKIDILSALSQATTRVRWDRKEVRNLSQEPHQITQWEYATDVSLADCLGKSESEHSSWSLDEALSHWGRYSWELITVAQADGKMIAYFKRPIHSP